MSSAYPIILWWSWECVLYLIIIIKPEVWIINHCLGLGHETMVCAVCLSMFLSSLPTPTLHQHYYNHITTQGPSSLKVVAVDTKDIDVSLDILPDNGRWNFTVGDEDHFNRGWRLLNVLQEAWWRLLQWIRLVKLTYQLRFLYDKTCTFEYIWSIQDDIAVYMTRYLRD